mgnify:CR=1 FL=1
MQNIHENLKTREFHFLGNKFLFFCNSIEKKYIIDYLYKLQKDLESGNYDLIKDSQNIIEISKHYLMMEEGIEKEIVYKLDSTIFNFSSYTILNKLRYELDPKVIQFQRKLTIDNLLK